MRDPSLAEDVAQSALQKLFNLQAAPRNIPAWLTTTIRHLAIDHHRRKEFRNVDPSDGIDDQPGGGSISSGVVNRAAIADVLAGLPGKYQRALMMSAGGFTNSEIAEDLGFGSAAVVAVTLSRLRRQLREQRLAGKDSTATLPLVNASEPSAGVPYIDYTPSADVMARIRQEPPLGLSVLEGSTPVVYFGDQPRARAATIGINPSHQEFAVRGLAPNDVARRFKMKRHLGVESLVDATDEVVLSIERSCREYFHNDPYFWFKKLDEIIKPLTDGASYYADSACHLDLVQWATDPVWRNLDEDLKSELIQRDKGFLLSQLSNPALEIAYLNGRQVCETLETVIDLEVRTAISPGDQRSRKFYRGWYGGTALVGCSLNIQAEQIRGEHRASVIEFIVDECRKDMILLGC